MSSRVALVGQSACPIYRSWTFLDAGFTVPRGESVRVYTGLKRDLCLTNCVIVVVVSIFTTFIRRKTSENIIEGQRRIDAPHSNFPIALCCLVLAHAMSIPGDYGRQCNPAVGEQ